MTMAMKPNIGTLVKANATVGINVEVGMGIKMFAPTDVVSKVVPHVRFQTYVRGTGTLYCLQALMIPCLITH